MSEAGRMPAEDSSMDSTTEITTIGPRANPADAALWQSVHDYLDNPPPLAAILRNPWKWLNSRNRQKS